MKLALSLAVLTALAVAATGDDARNGSKLKVELKLLGHTEVKAIVTNTGTETLRLLKTGTILSNAPVEKVQVTCNDTRVAFKGAWVRVMKEYLDASAFETLDAGKSVESVFDLCRMFDLAKGGQYTVQAKDSISVGGADNKIIGSVQYSSNLLQVHVDGALAAQSRTLAYSVKKRADDKECTGDKGNVMTKALQRCRELASAAEYEADQGQDARMEEYYKQSSREARDAVRDVFRGVEKVCSNRFDGKAHIYCQDVHKDCDDGTVALTYPHLSDMVFCDAFFKLIPASSDDCHAGDQGSVLVHEATHLREVKGTGDYGYGYDSVRQNSAQTNLNHADAYTYFSKSFYEKCSDGGDPGSYKVRVCRDGSRQGGCISVRGKSNMPFDFNRTASSLEGSPQKNCTAFQEPNCQGKTLKINQGQQMDVVPNGWNDQISSLVC